MPKSALPIETQDLGMVYNPGLFQKKKEGLRGLTLHVEPGEIFGYVGSNGAGKTTTIKILVGLQFATSGAASLYGIDVASPASRAKVGFLPENPYFYEYLTATEALVYYGRLSGLTRDEARGRAGRLLEQAGLQRDAGARVRGFSKGMRQRLGLAQALIHDPELLILDEPMTGLDPRGRAEVRELILAQREAGKTVFFSSHILSDVEVICDRVGFLQRGRLLMAGPLSEVVSRELLGIQVVFAGAPEDLARTGGVTPRRVASRGGGQVVADVADQEQADRLVAAVIAAKGRIVSVTPRYDSLEDVFLRLEASPGGPAGEDGPGERKPAGTGAAKREAAS